MKPTARRFRRALAILLTGWLMLEWAGQAKAQLTTSEEERLQILTDPDALRKKLEKDKNRPPFEFFRSQVAPFDILPYVKPNHWSTLTFELRANDDNYEGVLQTEAVKLTGMPHEVYFRRDGRLIKEQRARRGLQIMVPDADSSGQVRKQFMVELIRAGALRADANWQANLSTLAPHQMLVLILSKDSTTKFAAWSRMAATLPGSAERDAGDLEKVRYYRLVLPIDPDTISLSSHPLTWTTMSHIVWDNYPPDALSVSQQQAMLDWLHWGGQVVFCGGAGQSFSVLRESFLGPYLPGEATGATVALSEDQLRPLSQSYPPPHYASAVDNQSEPIPVERRGSPRRSMRVYRAPVPIRPGAKRPIYVAVLKAKEGAATIPLGEASPHLLAVESRVGRGRITMLAINPNEEALLAWPGLDTLIRRVILRRPEESLGEWTGPDGPIPNSPARARLLGQDLTWYRITSRDLTTPGLGPPPPVEREKTKTPPEPPDAVSSAGGESDMHEFPGVADWRDTASLPRLSRDLLEEASGITIPSSNFVLRVILAYLLAVVPLNWLVCRFVLNKREWTWVVVPLVALGFAIGVERVAAHDMGYDTATDEIDLLEIQGDYHRAHLTRLASLYTNGRSHFAVSYPNDPTALALPLNIGRSIRGEEIASSVWQSSPVPALLNFTVQPRSLAMFRAEEMLTLSGAIRLTGGAGKREIANESEIELRNAVLIESTGPGKRRERLLGTIKPGASVEIESRAADKLPQRVDAEPGPDPNPFLDALRAAWDEREENQGELRLVAWAASTVGGQVIDPPVDRKRGFTAVLVHLRSGPPPSPDGKRYNLLASGSLTDGQAVIERIAPARPATPPASTAARRRMRPTPKK